MTNTLDYEFAESGKREFVVNEVYAFTVPIANLGTSVSSPSMALTKQDGSAVTGTWFSGSPTVGATEITTPLVTMLAAGWYVWTLTCTADGNTVKTRGTFRVDA
jgi:hypothetical protein